jgi:hypothetical protein
VVKYHGLARRYPLLPRFLMRPLLNGGTLASPSSRVPKSNFAEAVDRIQAELVPFLKGRGFRRRGRTFNAATPDGLTWVVNLQMGASDPPGTTYFPGLRENLHGLVTINLGVYVPEVARHHGGGEAKSWVHDYHCCIRARLGEVSDEKTDLWWPAEISAAADVAHRLAHFGVPFLERFSTRDRILEELIGKPNNRYATVPRIVSAILLVVRGEADAARELLFEQAREVHNPRHPAYVRDLATRLGLGDLAG